jgi:2-methylcitrate dehydratase PrpD
MKEEAMPEYLDRICDFVVRTGYGDFSPEVIERGKKVVYDTIGAIVAGAQQNEPIELAKRMAPYWGAVTSSVIGQSRKADPLNAALINGTAGTFMELDEGNQFARGHAGVHVVTPALAQGEAQGVSGKDLLTAVILGYEIACRIGIASKLRMTMHPHGSWGTVGAAVAVGKLMKLDKDRMRSLINIASSMTLATSRKTMLEGGTVRNLYAGVSGYMGILAHLLLLSGFTGEEDGIGTVYGGVVSDSFNPDAMTEELGSRYEITRNYFKEYACCRYNHSSVDALYKIMKQQKGGRLDPQKIESIQVETYSLAAQLCWKEPDNMLAAKFSIPFAIATTLIHGNTGVGSFLPAKVDQPDIKALAALVEVKEEPEFTRMMPSRRPSRVIIKMKDGAVFTEAVFISRGDIEDPYSDRELETKFLSLTAPVYGDEKAKEILDRSKAVEKFDNINTYTKGL